MKVALLIPFAYFFGTRLRESSISFHVVFEWLAAAVLVAGLGSESPVRDLGTALLCYFAFISIYEIGYLVNDRFSSRREEQGRHRGPAEVPKLWVVAFVAVRLVAFSGVTWMLDQTVSAHWWAFFLSLAVVFSLHNTLRDAGTKSVTFIWLSWLRFVAPFAFVIPRDQFLGIAFVSCISYCIFRYCGYLDSKGLLKMEARRAPAFRIAVFVLPCVGVLPVLQAPEARGAALLCAYFAVVATAGTVAQAILSRTKVSR